MERHSGVRRRHTAHTAEMAVDGVPGRALRHLCLVWGLLCYDWVVCGEHTFRRTVHTDVSGEDIRWAEECGIAGMREDQRGVCTIYVSWRWEGILEDTCLGWKMCACTLPQRIDVQQVLSVLGQFDQ